MLAEGLGFELCRVARCTVPPHAGEFRAWLAEGRAGEMTWMERNVERRADPQLVLAGARSVVVLGMNYFSTSNTQHPTSNIQRGRIARYAWGDDYHDVIERKLRVMASRSLSNARRSA